MTVIDQLRAVAPSHASNVAIIDGDRRWTHAELWRRVDSLSHGLSSLGFGKGDVIMAWLPNCHESIESELACFQMGCIWVTLNEQMTWPEICGVLAATRPKVMIIGAGQASKVDIAHKATPTAFSSVQWVIQGTSTSGQGVAYEELLSSQNPYRPATPIGPDDIARLRYTSGTTGAAKAAILTHRVYSASLEVQQRELHPMGPADRVLHAAPLTHASGALTYPVLAAGGANVILPRFDTETVLEVIERERITAMFVVPTILQRLGMSLSFGARDLSSLRTITYGGAPISAEKLAPAMSRLDGVLVQIYGLTEALHPVTSLRREEHWPGNPRLTSIGKPTHINEVRIVDEDGNELGADEVGEITVRGPNVMAGYWNDESETARAFRGDWLLTGDLGYRDADGYYYIVDRRKDVVISGGFNVYTSEVERALYDHPAVAEAAVFGIPNDEWGEAVHAVVVPRADADLSEAELIAHCRELLSRYKVPKTITIQSESLPASGAGKIVKAGLREAYWVGRERRVH